MQTFDPKLHPVVMILAIALAGLAGCVTAPAPAPADGAQREVREIREAQTGSNLPRRGGSSTGAVEIDKNSVEDGLRGATRNTGK